MFRSPHDPHKFEFKEIIALVCIYLRAKKNIYIYV